MTFGEKIQTLRKEKGYSQEELAGLLEVSRQSVSNWERDNGLPEIEKIVSMSELFHVTMDYLLKDGTGTGQSDRPEAGFYVSRETASGFLAHQRRRRGKIGLAVGLLLGGTGLSSFDLSISTPLYTVLAVIGIGLLIAAALAENPYRRLWKETLTFDPEVRKKLAADYAGIKTRCYLSTLAGTALILVGLIVLPTVVPNSAIPVGVGMILVGFGVFLCIYWSGVAGAYRRLLGRGGEN